MSTKACVIFHRNNAEKAKNAVLACVTFHRNNAEKAKNAVLTNLRNMQAGLHNMHSCFIVFRVEENTLFYVQLNIL
jgi:hypothetical protein